MRARLFGLICFIGALALAQASARAAEATQGTGGKKSGDTLSEKLDRQKGVLKPKPGIDSEAEKRPPAPNPDSMPVIRPPAKPGAEAK